MPVGAPCGIRCWRAMMVCVTGKIFRAIPSVFSVIEAGKRLQTRSVGMAQGLGKGCSGMPLPHPQTVACAMIQDLQPLVEQYVASPTEDHRKAVVMAGVPLVNALIGRLSLPNSPLATWEDLEGAGLLGLMQALDSYDLSHGTPFISYCYGRVRGALVDYLRKIDVASQRRRRQIAEVQQAIETLSQICGGPVPDVDVADYLSISLEEYHAVLGEAEYRYALSLYDTTEEDRPMLEILPDHDGEAGFDRVEQEMLYEQVATLLESLPSRDRHAIALYFYEELTLREIGDILGLTPARISQIIGKALLHVRTRLLGIRETRAAA